MVIKMLTPHGTNIFDPSLDNMVNAGKKLQAYVTFKHGKVTNVDCVPQDNNSEWKYSVIIPLVVFKYLGKAGWTTKLQALQI